MTSALLPLSHTGVSPVLTPRGCCFHWWQERGVCWRCEQRLREAGCCPFGFASCKGGKAKKAGKGCKVSKAGCDVAGDCAADGAAAVADRDDAASAKAALGVMAAHCFCHHQGRCATCDVNFEACVTCRMAQGDGETLLSILEAWRPAHVFLDFDGCLCTTKGGANPLGGTQQHTVDAELHAAAVVMGGARTHVLTRNRHTCEIRTFLEERGVPIANVHTTRSGVSKHEYIAATLEAPDARAVFVDDAASEVGDPKMVADERVFRVLFQRW